MDRVLVFLLISISLVSCAIQSSPCHFGKQIFDFVVIGTGPASGPIIRRLIDEGRTVAVLEQGRFDASGAKPTSDPRYDDTFQVEEKVSNFILKTEKRFSRVPNLFTSAKEISPNMLAKLGIQSSSPKNLSFTKSTNRTRAYPYLQVKGFGGNTLTYGGLNLRPSPQAFASWGPGFSYEDMLPFYKASEKQSWVCDVNPTTSAHSCSNPTGFMTSIKEQDSRFPHLVGSMGEFCRNHTDLWLDTTNSTLDYNGDHRSRAFCGPPQVWGSISVDDKGGEVLTRSVLSNTYLPLEYMQSAANLQVCYNAPVRRLELDDSGTVTAAQISGSETFVYGSNFVLVSGVRHTPEILMKSGIGNSTEFTRFNVPTKIHLPHVGKFFHDEWAYALAFTLNNSGYEWMPENPDPRNRDQMHLIKWATGEQGANFTDVQLYLRLGNKLSLDMYQPWSIRGTTEYNDSFTIRVAMFQNNTFGSNSGLVATSSNGHYLDGFKVELDLFEDEDRMKRFMEGAIQGFKMSMEIVARMQEQRDSKGNRLNLEASEVTKKLIEIANVTDDPLSVMTYMDFLAALQDYGVVLALHAGGTAGIGRVVDQDLRVYNTSNLFIGDMSVFPNPVDANPSATLYAIGEKLAKHLLTLPVTSTTQNETCTDCWEVTALPYWTMPAPCAVDIAPSDITTSRSAENTVSQSCPSVECVVMSSAITHHIPLMLILSLAIIFPVLPNPK